MTWLTNWNRRKLITVNGSTTGALSDYQMKLTVNQASGTDSAGVINLGGNILTTFNDLRFTKSDGITELNHWIESITGTTPNQTATVWIKLAPSPDTIPASPGTYNFYIYYNNTGATATSSGTNTFIQWHGYSNTDFGEPYIITPNNIIYEVLVTTFAVVGNFGIKNTAPSVWTGDELIVQLGTDVNGGYIANNGTSTSTGNISLGTAPGRIKITSNGTTAHFYKNNVEIGTGLSGANYFPNENMGMFQRNHNGVFVQTWSFVRKYASSEPTFFTTGTEEIGATIPAATGGTETTNGGYRIHTFTTSGPFVANKAMNIEYLVVAGGGGGGGGLAAGGGGAGGFRTGTGLGIVAQLYSVVVGNGGAAVGAQTTGNNGSSSSFGNISSAGGGGGAGYNRQANAGGSGGGGYGYGTGFPGGAGNTPSVVPSQGNNGGTGLYTPLFYAAGGGGGAGYVGQDGQTTKAGDGGNGILSYISGSAVTYAGGGGGGTYWGDANHGSAGQGGTGGGANGSTSNTVPTAATANTGGGGGGGGFSAEPGGGGGAGGSGIVIIRYLLSEDLIPANITATNMSITTTNPPCRVGLCTVTVDVTWTNNGGSIGSFVPNITIDGSPITPIYLSQSLANGANVTKEFVITDLPAGTHPICPDPN